MIQFHSESAWLPYSPLSRGGSSGRSTSSMRSSSSRSHESRLFKISCKKDKVRYSWFHNTSYTLLSQKAVLHFYCAHIQCYQQPPLLGEDQPYFRPSIQTIIITPLLMWHSNTARWNKDRLKHFSAWCLWNTPQTFLFINILPSQQLGAFWNSTTLFTWNSKTGWWRDDVNSSYFSSHHQIIERKSGKPMLSWLFGTTNIQICYYEHQTLLLFAFQIVVLIEMFLKGLINHHIAWVC